MKIWMCFRNKELLRNSIRSDNTFNIVCKENGNYKTIEKGFKTRVDAQKRIKEMVKMYQTLLSKLKDHLKRKVE